MKKLIVFSLLLASFSSYSVEGTNKCFSKATEKLYDIVNPGQENFQLYVEELKACQEQGLILEDEYLNEDYNKCMDRADRKHDRDSNRCDKKPNASERGSCQKSADNRHSSSRASCERVGHSNNARDAATGRKGK